LLSVDHLVLRACLSVEAPCRNDLLEKEWWKRIVAKGGVDEALLLGEAPGGAALIFRIPAQLCGLPSVDKLLE